MTERRRAALIRLARRGAVAALAAVVGASSAAAQPASVAVRFDRTSITPVLAEGLADRATGRTVHCR